MYFVCDKSQVEKNNKAKHVKVTLIAVLAGATLGITSFASADMIDQEQNSATAYMAAFAQGDLAQSFQQANSNISGAGIFLQPNIGSTDNVEIQLWDALPNAGGTMLASASAMGTQGQWVDVFWSPVTVVPDTTYYLVFTGNTTLGIAGDISNPYPRGMVFANPGYQPFPDFDYTFHTYYAVPAPGSLALLGLGGLAMRRRR